MVTSVKDQKGLGVLSFSRVVHKQEVSTAGEGVWKPSHLALEWGHTLRCNLLPPHPAPSSPGGVRLRRGLGLRWFFSWVLPLLCLSSPASWLLWEHLLNKSLTHESCSQGLFLELNLKQSHGSKNESELICEPLMDVTGVHGKCVLSILRGLVSFLIPAFFSGSHPLREAAGEPNLSAFRKWSSFKENKEDSHTTP